jgi:hypothetical protein
VRCSLLGIVLFAGCYSPSYAPGAPCDTECPGDLVCIEHVCREPGYVSRVDAALVDAAAPVDTIDGPPGDGDADGVADADDNCPSNANADQHDEDADAIGDVCDPCPHLAGAAVDGDGDGVGDACDPQPAVAKQQIKFFDPFTANLTEWQHQNGVTRVGETLRINAGDSGLETRLNIANGETRIVAAGTVVSTLSSTPRQVSIAFGLNQATTIYHYCEFYDDSGSNTDIDITKANNGSYPFVAGVNRAGTFPTGAWSMRIDESVTAQQIRLEAKLGGTTYPLITGNTSTSPALTTSPFIEMYVVNVDLRLDYFLVIETLP